MSSIDVSQEVQNRRQVTSARRPGRADLAPRRRTIRIRCWGGNAALASTDFSRCRRMPAVNFRGL